MENKKQREIRLNEDGKQIPTRTDDTAIIIGYLMTYCVCPSDEHYNIRAIDYLLKKFQDRKRNIRELIETITWRGTRPSKCFTVPRTVDGRFQIALRKGFPHVVYARLWRWGDLEKCQIIHIPTCKYGYDLNRKHICVNPYHYKKITTTEEFFSRSTSDSNQNKNKSISHKKGKEAAGSQNIAVNDGGKMQGMPQQQQSQKAYQPSEENLIPIVVEHQSNATEHIEPQQPHLLCSYNEEPKVQLQIPETYPICNTLYANNIESTVPPRSINDKCGSSNNMHNLRQPAIEGNLYDYKEVQLLQGRRNNQNNTPLLHSGIEENANNFIRNVETPAVSLSMCEQVLLNQSGFENLSLSNNQRQDNLKKIIILPAPSNTLVVNNTPLLSNCNQPSEDLVRGDVGSVPMNAMPLPVPMNQISPPLLMNQMTPLSAIKQMPPPVSTNEMPPPRKIPLSSNSTFLNSNRQINLPPPSSTPLPNNPPTFQHSLFEDEDFQSTEKQRKELPTNYSQKLNNKDTSLNCTFERILTEGNSHQTASNNPLENTLNETLDQILSQVQNNDKKVSSTDQKLKNALLSSNKKPITTQSNNIEQVLNNNEKLADDNVPMEVGDFKEIIKDNNQQLLPISNAQHLIQNIEEVLSPISAVPPTNYSQKLDNKDTSLNCTFERILTEGNSQQAASNNPLENTLNETLDQILSQVQNNDKKVSSTDQKLKNALLSNNKEPITTQSNIEQVLNNNEKLADDNVSMEVGDFKETIKDNNQQLLPTSNTQRLIQKIEALLSPISAVPLTNYSHKLNNKNTSLNCTLEQILTEGNNHQTASNNPLQNTLNETLDQILSQFQNNRKLLSTDQKLKNALLSNNKEPITTQSNIEQVLNNNEKLADDNVPMEVGDFKEIIQQDNNEQLQVNSDAPPLIQNIEAVLSPISAVPPTNYSQKLDNKNTSLNCTLKRILTDGDGQRTASNNPRENILNETLNQMLSQVQNNDQKVSSTEQKFENTLLNNNTEPITSQSNIEQVLNSNEDLADDNVPMEVSNHKEMLEQNYNQQLQPISNASQLTQNIKAVSPVSVLSPLSPISSTPLSSISSITPLSPISTVRTQSPISNTQSLSPERFQCNSNLLLSDSDDKKSTGECSKYSTSQKQLQSDKTALLDEDRQETMTRNNNARQNTSLYFSDTMEQTQMSSISKCEHYLRNQSQDAELQRNKLIEFFNRPNMNRRKVNNNSIPIDDPPLDHWCSIDYFELDTQVGDTFKVKNEHTTVIVDGYVEPDIDNRFCLGRLTNIQRTEQSERTRIHIAQGIALELRKDGDIWLQCRSKTSVFIQAHFLDMPTDRFCRDSVHKIFSEDYKKVFDLQKCYKHIKAQVAIAQASLRAQAMTPGPSGHPPDKLSALQGLEAAGMNIDDLQRLCMLRISFVKGWGRDYPRQTIKETPCWIEVHIHKALQLLDNLLHLDKPIIRGMD